jgi:hypothetical protein
VAKNSWEVIVENKERTHTEKQILRRLRIFNDGTWTVTLHFFPEFNDKITDDSVKNFVWNNLDDNKTICHPNADGTCRHKKKTLIMTAGEIIKVSVRCITPSPSRGII